MEGGGVGGRDVDEPWACWGSCRNSMGGGWRTSRGRAGAAEIAWEEARDGHIEGDDPVDGRWTTRRRAGAAEIAWEEARDGGATSKRMMWVDGTWTSRGRAGAAAEIAWEGSRKGKPVKSRVANFSKKKGLYSWAFLAVGRNRLCMGCSGRSFAVEEPRRGKPAKSRGYVSDVVAGVLL